jgi:hypothetical protein
MVKQAERIIVVDEQINYINMLLDLADDMSPSGPSDIPQYYSLTELL